MGRRSLIATLVILIVADIWGVTEAARLLFSHSHKGAAAFWAIFMVVVLFNAGLIWITMRVWVRIQSSSK